jgi:hypothetical protein
MLTAGTSTIVQELRTVADAQPQLPALLTDDCALTRRSARIDGRRAPGPPFSSRRYDHHQN